MEHGFYDQVPRAEFSVKLSREEYIKARSFTMKRFGRLRNAPFFILLGAALILLGLSGLFYQVTSVPAFCLMLVLTLSGGTVIFIFAGYFPSQAAERAGEQYDNARTPSLPFQIRFYRDTFEVVNEYGSMLGYY